MKKLDFLKKLKEEEKLRLVNPSEEIKSSYLTKAENCLKSAKILFQNNLYENSVSEAYYSMYNSLLALLFRIGIKSETHAGSIELLKILFDKEDLYKSLSSAKAERIDKQYYIESKQDFKLNKSSCEAMIIKAEQFLISLRILISQLNNKKIELFRYKFKNLLEKNELN